MGTGPPWTDPRFYAAVTMPAAMATRLARGAAFAMLCVIWGSTWLAIRIGLQGAPPFPAASLRFIVAPITLVILAIAFGPKCPSNPTEGPLVPFAGLVLSTAAY